MWAEWQSYKNMYGQDKGFLSLTLKELKKHEKLVAMQFIKLQKERAKARTEKESIALLAQQDRVNEERTFLREIIKDALNTMKLINCGGVPH
jgi:5-methylcytosine-specific restriction endonuclease McrBC regulatory subunit McrC